MPDTHQPHAPRPSQAPNLQPASAVFEGGGTRGIAHVGALSVAESLGYRWTNVAGASAGALVAALVAAGYQASELAQIMRELDYRRFADPARPFNALQPIVDLTRLITQGGLHSGDYLEEFVRQKLALKGVRVFGDLRLPAMSASANPFRRYRLTIIASDITNRRLLRLPHDLALFPAYGLRPDQLEVARAVRMSASIPFFFTPVPLAGKNCRVVDGGLLSNFPLFLFDEPGKLPTHPTLGFRLVADRALSTLAPSPGANNPLTLARALLSTMLNAHDQLYLDDHTFARTIAIPTSGIQGTQFDLRAEQVEQLYQNGVEAAQTFFAGWDFEAYKAFYGAPETLHRSGRQQRLHARMRCARPPADL